MKGEECQKITGNMLGMAGMKPPCQALESFCPLLPLARLVLQVDRILTSK